MVRIANTARPVFVVMASVLIAASCSGDTAATEPEKASARIQPVDITDPTTTAPVTAKPFGELEAVERTRDFSSIAVSYIGAGVQDNTWDREVLGGSEALFGSHATSIDLASVDACVRETTQPSADLMASSEVFELRHAAFMPYEVEPGVWLVAFNESHVAPGAMDDNYQSAAYVTADGIAGFRSITSGTSCWDHALARTAEADALVRRIMTIDDLESFTPEESGPGAEVAFAAMDADAPDNDPDTDDTWERRPGFPADPSDPEPLRSTGGDLVDLITIDDPSAFVCVTYLGQGPEEILDRDKGGYERVQDAYLFTAFFADGSEIAIRVHPEVGSLDVARQHVDSVTGPLGRLPIVLRADIGRFAIRSGDQTATASPGEGISMQTSNMAVRLENDRLEETIFHESVHTSLDSLYSYQRSQAWLDAQNADGRFLTEYGRNNPDNEDFAESALYAYVVSRNPERFPSGMANLIKERIPHRIAFLAPLFDDSNVASVAALTCE